MFVRCSANNHLPSRMRQGVAPAEHARILQQLRTLASSQFTEVHEYLLRRMWAAHFGSLQSPPPYSRPDPRWKEMGFQGNDPTTDLRGVAVAAAAQLVHLLETMPNLWQLLNGPDCGTTPFSKAACLINISGCLFYYLDLLEPTAPSMMEPCRGDGGRTAASTHAAEPSCGCSCCCKSVTNSATEGFLHLVLLNSDASDCDDVGLSTQHDEQRNPLLTMNSPLYILSEIYCVQAFLMHGKLQQAVMEHGDAAVFHFNSILSDTAIDIHRRLREEANDVLRPQCLLSLAEQIRASSMQSNVEIGIGKK